MAATGAVDLKVMGIGNFGKSHPHGPVFATMRPAASSREQMSEAFNSAWLLSR